MTQGNDGGPAFPRSGREGPYGDGVNNGMSLRDWMAGQALAGLCANPGGPYQANAMSGWGLTNCTHDTLGEQSFALADAMLKAREKTP